jgi:molybdopterin-guanine dinucleotide biosynthesis protein A
LAGLANERLALVHDADLPSIEGLRALTDVRPFEGPVAAIAHGLRRAAGDVCMLVAGDMPFVSRAAFAYLLQLRATEEAAVVVPFIDGHIESMHAVFKREELLTTIEAAQHDGEQRLFKLFERLGPRLVDEAELRGVDPELHTLFNVNSPDDLTLAEEIARGIAQ